MCTLGFRNIRSHLRFLPYREGKERQTKLKWPPESEFVCFPFPPGALVTVRNFNPWTYRVVHSYCVSSPAGKTKEIWACNVLREDSGSSHLRELQGELERQQLGLHLRNDWNGSSFLGRSVQEVFREETGTSNRCWGMGGPLYNRDKQVLLWPSSGPWSCLLT